MAGNGNNLPDITGNARQKEGTKATQRDYKQGLSPPYHEICLPAASSEILMFSTWYLFDL